MPRNSNPVSIAALCVLFVSGETHMPNLSSMAFALANVFSASSFVGARIMKSSIYLMHRTSGRRFNFESKSYKKRLPSKGEREFP